MTEQKPPPFCFIIDTREQTPWELPEGVSRKLDIGDYSVDGFEAIMAIERKSFDDLYKCLGTDLARFTKQMKALGKLQYKALLIESTANAIMYGHPISGIKGKVAMIRLLHLCVTNGVPLFFCDRHGPTICAALLVEFWKIEEKNGYQEETRKKKGGAKKSTK